MRRAATQLIMAMKRALKLIHRLINSNLSVGSFWFGRLGFDGGYLCYRYLLKKEPSFEFSTSRSSGMVEISVAR